MTISESQLETWAKQGAVTTSASTYATIKAALESSTAGYAGKDYEIYLQGSYGNDTNIYKESDVDIVIQLNSTFFKDISKLPPDQVALYNQSFVTAEYLYATYKADVIKALKDTFGDDVVSGKKAIKIKAKGNRRSADVIPACQYRRYKHFRSHRDQDYTEGIYFKGSDGTSIKNYPKEHSKNLTQHHQATGQMLKPFTRILKNMRTRLVDEGAIDADLAPSYFIEGLLYNAPKSEFKGNYQDTFVAVMEWLRKADRTDFVCVNYQYYLLRGDSLVTWTPEKCQTFITAIIKMWNDGRV
ncbi:MAG: hypothetical protein A2X28_06355 [Elusimicrobia bacterium GWA2_56_46]|nr:MAG: hypothetical protein A2X28_06355 [Elusimicrobia bacterium GWA2_56_46]OGR54923.1 MAG: hypothetical protein A2X39_11635 [Elusimicrobia bacterium GWC2_56_31]HBW23279.1 nucleotidyltransferase [Elusimicrobiota bacterium]